MDYVEPTQNGAEDDTIKDDTPSVSEETTKEIKEKEAREDAETIEWVNQQESSLDTITALVLERIRLRARRRILWLRHLWHEASEGEQEHNYHTEVDAFLDNKDRPEAEYHWVNRKKKLGNLNESIADIEDTLTHHRQSRLSVLSQVFNLTDAESDLVQACFAISVEPNLSKVYAYLQDNQTRGYVTEELVARLYGHGYSLSLSTESPLKTWGLIQEKDMGKGEPTRLVCDPYIRNWLLDISNLDQSLVGIARLQSIKPPLSNWNLQEALDFVKNALDNQVNMPIRFFVAGAEGTGRRTLSACVAQALRLPLLTINSDGIAEQDAAQTFMRAQRLACLDGFALAWTGQHILNRPWKNTRNRRFARTR